MEDNQTTFFFYLMATSGSSFIWHGDEVIFVTEILHMNALFVLYRSGNPRVIVSGQGVQVLHINQLDQ